jgi:hypothetical protein
MVAQRALPVKARGFAASPKPINFAPESKKNGYLDDSYFADRKVD